MKTTIYVPVYIEGKEENLPKEDGDYFVRHKLFKDGNWIFRKNLTQSWLNGIDFWLKPVELPDDEEIIDVMDDYGQRHSEDAHGYSIYGITSSAFNQGAKWFKSQILNK